MPGRSSRRFGTASGSPRSARSPPSAPLATASTTRWPKTVNGDYNAELIHGPAGTGPWKTIEEVKLAILGWVPWHNTQRLHGYLGDLPPVEFEALHAANSEPSTPDPGDRPAADTAQRPSDRLSERAPSRSKDKSRRTPTPPPAETSGRHGHRPRPGTSRSCAATPAPRSSAHRPGPNAPTAPTRQPDPDSSTLSPRPTNRPLREAGRGGADRAPPLHPRTVNPDRPSRRDPRPASPAVLPGPRPRAETDPLFGGQTALSRRLGIGAGARRRRSSRPPWPRASPSSCRWRSPEAAPSTGAPLRSRRRPQCASRCSRMRALTASGCCTETRWAAFSTTTCRASGILAASSSCSATGVA
jgi:hypothetical protein